MALPDPGIEPGSPAWQADSLPAQLPGKSNLTAKTRGFHTQLDKLVAQLVKSPPAMQETPVRFLGQKDPPEKG